MKEKDMDTSKFELTDEEISQTKADYANGNMDYKPEHFKAKNWGEAAICRTQVSKVLALMETDMKELREELRVGNILTAQLMDKCRALEAQLARYEPVELEPLGEEEIVSIPISDKIYDLRTDMDMRRFRLEREKQVSLKTMRDVGGKQQTQY